MIRRTLFIGGSEERIFMMISFAHRVLKLAIFVLIAALFLGFFSRITMRGYEGYNYQMSAGFFEEPENSLDAVYIGASPVFTSWIAPIAYKKYDIAMRVYANDSQPFVAVNSLMKILREHQPNALYLIAINGLYSSSNYTVESMHWTTDYLPNSFERINLICNTGNSFNFSAGERLELVFPLIRYHSTWNMLNKVSFHPETYNLKGGLNNQTFFSEVQDISSHHYETDKRSPLPNFTQDALTELLDYCRDENVNVIFIVSAQYRDEWTLQQYNTMIDEIETSGYSVINELADFERIGLDDTTDFYNAYHTNVHGALKITDYLSRYLLDHYDFPEKSGGGL